MIKLGKKELKKIVKKLDEVEDKLKKIREMVLKRLQKKRNKIVIYLRKKK